MGDGPFALKGPPPLPLAESPLLVANGRVGLWAPSMFVPPSQKTRIQWRIVYIDVRAPGMAWPPLPFPSPRRVLSAYRGE